MAKHKHANEIHAFAEGAEIQQQLRSDYWVDDPNPTWCIHNVYRIKPRTVKREGWASVYKHYDGVSYLYARIYGSEDDAKHARPSALDIIKIEWEEEA